MKEALAIQHYLCSTTRGGTLGVAGILGQPSFERGDPGGLLLDDGESLDD